jgi:hypothetical protein
VATSGVGARDRPITRQVATIQQRGLAGSARRRWNRTYSHQHMRCHHSSQAPPNLSARRETTDIVPVRVGREGDAFDRPRGKARRGERAHGCSMAASDGTQQEICVPGAGYPQTSWIVPPIALEHEVCMHVGNQHHVKIDSRLDFTSQYERARGCLMAGCDGTRQEISFAASSRRQKPADMPCDHSNHDLGDNTTGRDIR